MITPTLPHRETSVDLLPRTKRRVIGIPTLFIADQLARGRTPDQVLCGQTSLLTEFAGAEGFVYSWGYCIEQRFGKLILLRIVPITLWERLADARHGTPWFIWELQTACEPMVRAVLDPALPAGLVITGCQGDGRRSPHALFSLLLSDTSASVSARQWLEGTFLPVLLPDLLALIEQRIVSLFQRGGDMAAFCQCEKPHQTGRFSDCGRHDPA